VGEGRGEGRRLWLPLAALFLAAASGCATVKPHQREYLADRIMKLDGNAQEQAADAHVLSNREGAIGGSGTAGGGCGCN
jgi:Domain of unknown function (DUF4266)